MVHHAGLLSVVYLKVFLARAHLQNLSLHNLMLHGPAAPADFLVIVDILQNFQYGSIGPVAAARRLFANAVQIDEGAVKGANLEKGKAFLQKLYDDLAKR